MNPPGSLTLIGHCNQRTALAKLVHEQRLPSSLLFSGVAGVGKRLVARELASQLLCMATQPIPAGGCGECQSCRLICAGNHPDLRSIDCGGSDFSSDTLRETLEQLSLRPFLGKAKATILNDADTISTVCANILLKTLEEPRPENFFILVATTPSRLPQTVLSRCQRWFFDRLSNEDIASILDQRGASQEERDLIPFADGSCAALESINAKAELRDEMNSVLDAAWRGDTAAIAKTAQDWGTDKTSIAERLQFLRASIRERLLGAAPNPGAAAVWAHGLQNAIDAEYLVVDRHVNPTLTILAVLQSCQHDLAVAYQIAPNSSAPVRERLLS
jgi:DNA polymerase III gamma/tau subunit